MTTLGNLGLVLVGIVIGVACCEVFDYVMALCVWWKMKDEEEEHGGG